MPVLQGDVRPADRKWKSLPELRSGASFGQLPGESDELPVPLVVDGKLRAGDPDLGQRAKGVLGGQKAYDVVVDLQPPDAQQDFRVLAAVDRELPHGQKPEDRRRNALVGDPAADLLLEHREDLLFEPIHPLLDMLRDGEHEERAGGHDQQKNQHLQNPEAQLYRVGSQFIRSRRKRKRILPVSSCSTGEGSNR